MLLPRLGMRRRGARPLPRGRRLLGPLDRHKIHSSPADLSGVTAGDRTPPPPTEPVSKRPRATIDTSDPAADLQKQRDAVEESLREKGLIPSIANLEAYQRVGAGGLALFKELAGQVAGQLSRHLQGKIDSLTAENRYFEGRLLRVQAELDSQRDNPFYSISQDNRAQKEEMELLKGVQEGLQPANVKVAEQEKQLKRLPELERERDQALRSTSEAEEETKKLRSRVEELSTANEAAEVRYGKATAEGFQRAVDLTAVLAPNAKWQFFDGNQKA